MYRVQQPQASVPLTGMTQAYTGLVYSQLGKTYIGGQQPLYQQSLLKQPWRPQYQQQQFKQYQPHPGLGQQSYARFGKQQVYRGPGQ